MLLTKIPAYAYNRFIVYMKQTSSTTPVSVLKKATTRYALVVVALLMSVFVPLSTMNSVVRADTFDDKIRAIEAEVSGFQAEASRLASEADSLSTAVSTLAAQRNAIQAQVDLSQAKYEKLLADIAANEAKLASTQDVLTSIISSMIAEDQASPIEILASSSTVGDYIIRQERLGSVQGQLQGSIEEIANLKKQLADQKVEAEHVLADQKAQRDILAAKEAEQSQLLAATQGQAAAYSALVVTKQSEAEGLRAEQRAVMARSGAGEGIIYGSSAYPWPDASMNYNDSCYYSDGSSAADDWGYCKRQCVSYVAWKLNSDGRGNRGYSMHGNAIAWWYSGNWVEWSNLAAGDVIVWDIGYYGHVMYVDFVSGDKVGISQMNVPYDSGAFSTKTYDISTLQNGSYTARSFH